MMSKLLDYLKNSFMTYKKKTKPKAQTEMQVKLVKSLPANDDDYYAPKMGSWTEYRSTPRRKEVETFTSEDVAQLQTMLPKSLEMPVQQTFIDSTDPDVPVITLIRGVEEYEIRAKKEMIISTIIARAKGRRYEIKLSSDVHLYAGDVLKMPVDKLTIEKLFSV